MPSEVGGSYEVSSDPDGSIWQPHRLYHRSIFYSSSQHPRYQEANIESLLPNKRTISCDVSNLFIWKAISLLPEILKTALFCLPMTLNEILMVVFEAELCRLPMSSPTELGFETHSFREQESPSLPASLW